MYANSRGKIFHPPSPPPIKLTLTSPCAPYPIWFPYHSSNGKTMWAPNHRLSNRMTWSECTRIPTLLKGVAINIEKQTRSNSPKTQLVSSCRNSSNDEMQPSSLRSEENPFASDNQPAITTDASADNQHGKTSQGKGMAKVSGHDSKIANPAPEAVSGRIPQCSVCNSILSSDYNLRVHMRIHLKSKPYKCGFCSKTFRTKCNLNQHEF